MIDEKSPEACLPKTDRFMPKRLLWCSTPNWESMETTDYYADTLWLLRDGDDNHCLELKVGGHVCRMEIKNPWKYI